MNEISAYSGEDFDLVNAITDIKIPLPHRKAIRRELEKLANFPYDHLVPPKKTLRPLGSLSDNTPLYELPPHCPNKTQYRMPLVSPKRLKFLILGFFPRKDANFTKQIVIAEERYKKVQLQPYLYEQNIDLEQIIRI